ncbi:PLC-like phosphodiesterase, TIM beta/alpha-barrel domain protein [Niveomyces insectorum RCEF 264]|uniref:PLC-like phosphodiesterase, TIM beta/alpha-barrel domain protein n=1 Tax=Niveomyces insectorum RCEF 264 TaxID=1081102 RepID=A0A168AF31_9HYPO|nr:PLC-like phosphodiesterase, TIM beta/alpha-barrel domain protein [Niveomyces insectorum RCEF 264]
MLLLLVLSVHLLLFGAAEAAGKRPGSRLLRTSKGTGRFGVGRAGGPGKTRPSPAVLDGKLAITEPCNGHVDLCKRRYSNITFVGAHNSPFVLRNNLAANQALTVTEQLDDGVRFLQAQMQWPTNASVPHFCHTSCDLLDAGPITDWLGEVAHWVAHHPYDVVTVLLGNGNYSTPDRYAPLIASTGLPQYAYVPPHKPMALDDWPTLETMILRGTRVVLLLDYMADETAYPWLLDEFTYLWETPFDPLIDAGDPLPCTVQRPPGLPTEDAVHDRLYLLNHNLNVEVSLLGMTFLIPTVAIADQINAVAGPHSLGDAAAQCASTWQRAPTVLNVDYYNYGSPPGSVFEVAAKLNNVTYDPDTCCGEPAESRADRTSAPWLWTTFAVVVFGIAARV